MTIQITLTKKDRMHVVSELAYRRISRNARRNGLSRPVRTKAQANVPNAIKSLSYATLQDLVKEA